MSITATILVRLLAAMVKCVPPTPPSCGRLLGDGGLSLPLGQDPFGAALAMWWRLVGDSRPPVEQVCPGGKICDQVRIRCAGGYCCMARPSQAVGKRVQRTGKLQRHDGKTKNHSNHATDGAGLKQAYNVGFGNVKTWAACNGNSLRPRGGAPILAELFFFSAFPPTGL
jgi:hypothetical protein